MSKLAYLAVSIFGRPIEYFEAVAAYDLGRHIKTPLPIQTLFGTIQPASQAEVKMLPSGQQADVKLTLHTKKELKISIQDQDGTDTFIKYREDIYKAVAFGDWSQEKFYKYGLIRTEEAR